jgi:hypothetical protein
MQWKSNITILMKGGAEANAQAQQQFYSTLTANYNKEFAQWTQVLNGFQSQLKPIIDAGIGQFGLTPGEETALRTDVSNQTTKAFNDQRAALQNRIAQQGGGEDFMPSGAKEQLQEELANNQARESSELNTGITKAGYDLGRQNFLTAMGMENSVLNAMNPNAFAGAATGAGNAATNAINVANTTSLGGWGGIIGGVLNAGVGALTGGLTSAMFKPSSATTPLTSPNNFAGNPVPADLPPINEFGSDGVPA